MVSDVAGWPQLTQMECSSGFCLAVDLSGNVWARGNNFYGQLGDGTNTNKTLPVRLTTIAGVKSVAAQRDYAYAITVGGDIYSWGDFFLNGRDDRIVSNVPRQIPGLGGVMEISLGGDNRLVRLQNGTVFGWGYNQYGELGTSSPAASFVPVQMLGVNLN